MPPIESDGGLVESLLREVLNEIKSLTTQINIMQVDQANLRGDTAARILEQANVFDAKLLAAERRIEDKMAARAEKVDGWFDAMQTEFSNYKTSTESRITAVSIKVGAIIGGVSIVISGVVALVVRYFSHQ
jgi:hypothetical protein